MKPSSSWDSYPDAYYIQFVDRRWRSGSARRWSVCFSRQEPGVEELCYRDQPLLKPVPHDCSRRASGPAEEGRRYERRCRRHYGTPPRAMRVGRITNIGWLYDVPPHDQRDGRGHWVATFYLGDRAVSRFPFTICWEFNGWDGCRARPVDG